MALERKDLRIKLDPDDHAGLSLLAECEDCDLAELADCGMANTTGATARTASGRAERVWRAACE